MPARPRLPQLTLAALGGLGLSAAVWALWAFDPATSDGYPPCPISWLTGWQCPGCGTLRGLHALMHGRFAEALAFNPLTLLGVPLALAWLVAECLQALGFHVPAPRITPRVVLVASGVFLGWGVVRNL